MPSNPNISCKYCISNGDGSYRCEDPIEPYSEINSCCMNRCGYMGEINIAYLNSLKREVNNAKY